MSDRLHYNLTTVRGRIAEAAQAAGRSADDVRLVAATKYVDAATTGRLAALGQLDLGESRPQQLWEKAAALKGAGVRWHLIGHLQRNKVRRTLPHVHLLHSGDSDRLLAEVNQERAAAERAGPGSAGDDRAKLGVLLEVNISGDMAKHGFAPEALGIDAEAIRRFADRLSEFSHLDVRGLMCMAGLDDDPAGARRDFARLRELRDRLQRDWAGRFTLAELSMGMSGDFESAIAEGATIVRVGSALFEGVSDDGDKLPEPSP
jgi:pyridoxal phosphate enzyme (YggS family)